MVKQGVIPDEMNKPFYDAANQGRLVIQNCKSCSRLQHPPVANCDQCGSGDNLEWKEMSGRGKIYNYGVVHDCPIRLLQDDLPFNLAVIMLDDDPGILRLISSNLRARGHEAPTFSSGTPALASGAIRSSASPRNLCAADSVKP